MPSAKRKPRRKTADVAELENLDSSPTAPSAKKRKPNGTRNSTRRRHSVSNAPAPVPMEDSGDESETVSQGDLIDSIISYLSVSKEPIVAATEFSNEKEQPVNMQKVSAYAKIAGRDWTYFVREQSVNIGRPPDGVKDGSGLPFGASSPADNMKEILPVHIDLGPSKIVSRHHASIFYDSEYPEGGGWHIRVNGRNGVKVNNVALKRGGTIQLKSGAIFEIAGTQMMFVTPGDKAVIHPMFIDRAKALATGEELSGSHAHPEPTDEESFPAADSYPSIGNYQSLAPAPPNFKRETTPPPPDMKNGRGVFDSKPVQSPMYNRGMMMESTHEIDYSKDAAKDLKPPYSYATMIAQAIFSSEEEKLTLSNIYAYIAEKYAFYRHSNSGWQNSIRHNLSLNKAFEKVPRRTDEPGKGMKWQIAPAYRQEYWKKQQRKGANSSQPTSPAGKEINPNFRGPNGQNLGYDTTMVNQFSAKDMSEHNVPARRNPHMNFPPLPNLQPPPPASQQTFTPQRRRTDTQTTAPDPDLDDSPLPHAHFRHSGSQQQPVYTLPSSVPPPPQQSPSNPTLSSSYLDTPFPGHHSSGPGGPMTSSILTPAPLRQNPRLAPPSTLVAPSKFMPESSPAGPAGLFWKGAFGGVTPGVSVPDLSPDKIDRSRGEKGRSDADGDSTRGIMSSSPPPMDGGGSPTKVKTSGLNMRSASFGVAGGPPGDDRRVNGMSMTNGNAGGPGEGQQQQQKRQTSGGVAADDDDDDNDAFGGGGFDLARGFARIGSSRPPTTAATAGSAAATTATTGSGGRTTL